MAGLCTTLDLASEALLDARLFALLEPARPLPRELRLAVCFIIAAVCNAISPTREDAVSSLEHRKSCII